MTQGASPTGFAALGAQYSGTGGRADLGLLAHAGGLVSDHKKSRRKRPGQHSSRQWAGLQFSVGIGNGHGEVGPPGYPHRRPPGGVGRSVNYLTRNIQH